jgi:hypothetical protein
MPEPNFSYTFDERLNNGRGGYRAPNGRIVAQHQVRTALDRYVDAAQLQAVDLGDMLRAGTIDLKQWQLSMRTHIKNMHINAAIAANGGRQQMTPAEWGRVGQRIKYHYERLDNFATEIANGKQPLDGRFMVRSKMYTEAAIATHDRTNRALMKRAGYTHEQNKLEAGANHCGGCIAETAKGKVEIGRLTPVGERTCLSNCRCTIIYFDEGGQQVT